MRILLLGDYSNVHATLAEGLRALGHDVVVASDGDGWKNYPRDIDLRRYGLDAFQTSKFLLRLWWNFRKFKGFDVVQIINPVFLQLKAEKILPYYKYLKRHNKKVFMAAFGMDHYWVKAGLDCKTFRYSDFNIGAEQRRGGENDVFIADWLEGPKGRLNEYIAKDCDGIPAGLYEYWASYKAHCPEAVEKMQYIPFPIKLEESNNQKMGDKKQKSDKVRFFIGIQKARSVYKGTDIMLRALERVEQRYPDLVDIRRAESVPFAEYKQMMNSSDVILDQLYSYTPAMNALQAMSQGLIVVGGAEPEYYELQEKGVSGLRPIINVEPNEASVFEKLCWLVEHSKEIPRLKRESREFVKIYHDHVKVARQYLDFWDKK